MARDRFGPAEVLAAAETAAPGTAAPVDSMDVVARHLRDRFGARSVSFLFIDLVGQRVVRVAEEATTQNLDPHEAVRVAGIDSAPLWSRSRCRLREKWLGSTRRRRAAFRCCLRAWWAEYGWMQITPRAFAHVRLTVTDINRSRAFYEDLFGLPVAVQLPPDADDKVREDLSFLYGGVVYQLGDSLFGLRPVASDRFDEDRVGLDHVSFALSGREDLESALRVLEDRGIPNAGIKDIGMGYILEFRDPDNIALELFAPAT